MKGRRCLEWGRFLVEEIEDGDKVISKRFRMNDSSIKERYKWNDDQEKIVEKNFLNNRSVSF